MQKVLLLTDGRAELKAELRHRKNELETLSQLIHRLESEYSDLRTRYQEIDKAWALRDGRFKVIKATPKEKKPKNLTQEEINRLIEELTEMAQS